MADFTDEEMDAEERTVPVELRVLKSWLQDLENGKEQT